MQQTRSNFLALVEELTLEQVNKIPAGFNNNIIWNFGHTIVTQQLLCYHISDYAIKIEQDFVDRYRKGTKPESDVSVDDWQRIVQHAKTTLGVLQTDYNNGFFTRFNAYTTSYGVALNSIEDTIKFLPVHEGLHYGYAMALKKLV